MTTLARAAARQLVRAVNKTLKDQESSIFAIADAIRFTLSQGGTVFVCGNGGSCSSAQHLSAELVGRFKRERGPLSSVCLGTNPSTFTAVANDYGVEQVFVRELAGLSCAKDLLIVLTTSGKSANVLAALAYAKEHDIVSIALTGARGISLQERVDICVAVPSTDTPRIQEVHDFIIHVVCEALDETEGT